MFLKCFFYRLPASDYLNNICYIADTNSGDFNIINTNYCIDDYYRDIYIFDIQFFIFDNLSEEGNRYIEDIFKKMATDSIDYDKWCSYLLYYVKPKMIGTDIHKKYYSNKNIENGSHNILLLNPMEKIDERKKVIDFSNNDDFYALLEETYQEWYEYSSIACTEKSLLFQFLNIIFDNKNNLCIRYCRNCNRYYITSKNSKQKYCNRNYSEKMTCLEYRQSLEDTRIKKLEKRIRDLIRSNPLLCDKFKEYGVNFKEYRIKLKEEYKYDINGYVKTLVDTFYQTNAGKKRVIDDLNLYSYFDKKYIDEISN